MIWMNVVSILMWIVILVFQLREREVSKLVFTCAVILLIMANISFILENLL